MRKNLLFLGVVILFTSCVKDLPLEQEVIAENPSEDLVVEVSEQEVELPQELPKSVYENFDHISKSTTKYLIWWGEKVAMVENCPGGYEDGGSGSDRFRYSCADSKNQWLQFEWLDGSEVRVPGNVGENFLLDYRNPGGSSFQWSMTKDEKYWIYLDDLKLVSYDVATTKKETLMSFLAVDNYSSCSGISFFGWNPSHTKLGIIVGDETENGPYPADTRVFVLSIEDGKLTNKSKYVLRVLPDCSANNGPTFAIDWVDDDTIGYFDPSDSTDYEYLESLFLSDNPWGSKYASFQDVK